MLPTRPPVSHADALSVQDAMARLPVDQREVVSLVLVEGLSYKEAAEIIGVPVGTITSQAGTRPRLTSSDARNGSSA